MREITSHKVNPANDVVSIFAADQPGAGGANHRYELLGIDPARNPSVPELAKHVGDLLPIVLAFQNGPIPENGTNGLTHEMLLAILADRLQSFQDGPYACEENAVALAHINAAMTALKARTYKRMDRGVEGTHTI